VTVVAGPRRRWKASAVVGTTVLVVDQLTKWWASEVLADQTIDNIELVAELPELISDALRKATRGRVRVETEVVGLDRLIRRIDGSSHRVVESVVAAATLICATMLFVTDHFWLAMLALSGASALIVRLLVGYLSPWAGR
jgi:hypothetical protein